MVNPPSLIDTDMNTDVNGEAPRPVTPLSILVDHLRNALQELQPDSAVSIAALQHLRAALQLAAGLDPYLEAFSTPESPALAAIAQATRSEAWNQRYTEGATSVPLEQEMLSGHLEGQLLKMCVALCRASNVLEIGMFTGYATLAMAEALPPDGHLIACEFDPYVAGLAQALFQEAPDGPKIQVRIGPALETLDQLAAEGQVFDLVFIDATKAEYVQYFQKLLAHNLLAPQGIICVDNTLFQGEVYLPPEQRTSVSEAIAHFNQVVAEDPRVEQVILPVRDGVTIIRRV